MIITYLRSSSYQNYDYCQMQYFLNYVLGIPQISNQKADQGTIVHKVLEILASAKKIYQENQPFVINDVVGEINFTESNITNYDDAFIIYILDKCYNFYKNKFNIHEWTDEKYNLCKKWVFDEINYQNGLFNPLKRNIFETEQKFDIVLPYDWAHYKYDDIEGQLGLKGTIDLVTEIDNNTLEVIDFKTGQRKNWATGEKKDLKYLQTKDFQLMLYFYALKHKYPDKNILITIFFIRDGGPFTVSWENKDIKQIETKIRKRFEEIKKNSLPQMIHSQQKDFKCYKLCHYYKNKWPKSKKNICKFINDKIETEGIDYVVNNYSDKNHNIDYYNAPG